jgi:hypothetical protein
MSALELHPRLECLGSRSTRILRSIDVDPSSDCLLSTGSTNSSGYADVTGPISMERMHHARWVQLLLRTHLRRGHGAESDVRGGAGMRFHVSYTEPHETRGTWTSPPRCFPDQETAQLTIDAITLLAGSDARCRRTWNVTPCDGTTDGCTP